MTSPTINFGRHRGMTIEQVPADYVRWLADPERSTPKAGTRYPPLPDEIIIAARERLAVLDAEKVREDFAKLALGGHETGLDHPVYIIECEGNCYSKSGPCAIDYKWFKSLDETLAYMATEFPIEKHELLGGEEYVARSTPDPEDDKILIWEVLPSAHRKIVWGFLGWHYTNSQDEHACGQGMLPGDETSLFDQALKEH